MLTKVISNKTAYGDKELVLETVMKDKNREHFMYRVFGTIEGHEIGRSRFTRVNEETKEAEQVTFTKFFGEFYAKNASGAEFESAVCFLPTYVSGQFVTALTGEGALGIDFAYDIFCVYDKSSATSYAYIAQPVKNAEDKAKSEAKKAQFLASMPVAQIENKAAKK